MNLTQTRKSLANDIWRACDILRRDNNCGGVMEYIGHLAWLLFLRFLDAQEENWEAEATLEGREHVPLLPPDLRWRNWARRDWDAEALLKFVHGRLIPTLQGLGGDPQRETISGVFTERNVVVAASSYNLKEVLAIVNSIDFHNQDGVFTVGHVYEDLLRRLGNEIKMADELSRGALVTAPHIQRRNTLEESILGSVAPRFDVVLTNPPFGGTEGRHIQANFPVPSNAT